MVDRCEITGRTPCTVVDLDGTYIDGNTLKIYLRCGIGYGLRKRLFKTSLRLLAAVASRKCGLIGHERMKETILSALYPHDEILPAFKKKALAAVNPCVRSLLSRNRDRGHRILLATAAPDYYVRSIWNGDFVATVFKPGQTLVECRGEEKLRRVNEWLEDNCCTMDTVVTDHSDDGPVVSANTYGINILVKPSKSTLRFFRQLKPAHLFLVEDIDDLGVTR